MWYRYEMTTRQGEQFINCPICNKRYPSFEIENHADKCIFLTTEAENTVATKRACDYEQSTSSVKRLKHDSMLNSHQEEIFSHSYNNSMKAEIGFESIINSTVPLAEQMRPCDLQNYMGQEHVLGQKSVLRTLLEKRDIPSMILWGPPGCGKTTLAHIIAKLCKGTNQGSRFVKLSATMVGVNDIKEVVKIAKNELTAFKRRTILFMDEIHRFNKLQQDIFLPHIESGIITLIGATTENPSFSLNSALLSRCRVIVLEKIGTENMITILQRALRNVGARIVQQGETNINNKDIARVLIDTASVHWLAEMCDGDARIALNSLQLALQSKDSGDDCQVPMITLDDIKEGVKRSHLLYDKKGDEHYNIISAVHKSIRASDDNAALYWLTRMMQGGEDPIFIARRLVRAASEDIGLADPKALPLAVATMQGCQLLGMPECDVLLAECAIYLARAPKSTEAYRALIKAKQCITDHQGPHPSVPLHLRNAPTRLMKDLGYGKGYNMAHKDVSNLIYMPEGMEKVNFFH